ncbi:MAG TPA: RNB domain-containing ribonuclease, partial [Ilumatobacteraceae bacterium]|nr:RNB domain-containing ribonuclease [Ilumatobacteraceae bacterium]
HAKLAYETVIAADLPEGFDEFVSRAMLAEERRGASRVETPEQEIEPDGHGGYHLAFRPRLASEVANASLSLSTNLAVATLLRSHHTGLFRVMAEPDERAIRRLRHTARGLGLVWPPDLSLRAFELTLTDAQAADVAAFQMAVRRSTGGAVYQPFVEGVVPWHAAVAASYVHATAPLRRLADRYVVEAALAIAAGDAVPEPVEAAFATLPEVMRTTEGRAAQVDRAAIDLIEAVVLHGREGAIFDAVVTDADERGARVQLLDPAVIARVNTQRVEMGEVIRVRLVEADPQARQVRFERVN